ncbi:hypothetical protein QBC33DRAFT_519819 [Phialemonium atrogriseum]|uniref:Uncharacterized protein n=1 Tax=Phialemonium atrogriseum TaxID=1093897 RepID=A0AAJ0FII9_9PEZI|nr:uncharacterized protein QBC33DRAFT_519819 [Phialemonium atrogriseum]KAK1762150.1 hypothetical protein QBC33DRAFT_519819 [Phialemonium atrogriseum]
MKRAVPGLLLLPCMGLLYPSFYFALTLSKFSDMTITNSRLVKTPTVSTDGFYSATTSEFGPDHAQLIEAIHQQYKFSAAPRKRHAQDSTHFSVNPLEFGLMLAMPKS